MKSIILKPVLTEKSKLISRQEKGRVCVEVNPKANKFQIKKAFEELFRVKVEKVNTTRKKPVLQKSSYLQRFPGKSYTKMQKKAFIKLTANQKLNFLEKEAEKK
ncbi:MAG: 50S ribosomal protein L23 [Candidatus Moeniiplasma glomeromycotorum]|nr:50S ribosomal protein L23 [Candidatus Moeniiplasma glomeromycotorum]MCE8167021.1 50S ribosomal protein L23 [Candidatus Moeniiplasma glomeromycotorum]MCE8168967.1 50S ribosomal protein L23 [Candidatus Moeniiplasma glomeromycotorum]